MTNETEKGRLSKSLGLVRLSLYGIGTIIGAGIYSVIGPAAAQAGDAIWMSFLLAAVISGFSALSYAELASALPNAGAEHTFMRQALPKAPAVAFAIGLFIVVHGAATFATVGLTFGYYLQTFWQSNATAIALLLMVMATSVNIAGIKKASAIGSVLTVVQVTCLLGFGAYAIVSNGAAIPPKIAMPTSWPGVLQGAAIVFFVFSGYEHMATMAEEAKNPDRDIWRAFMVALGVTTGTYLLVIFGVLALVEVGGLSSSEFPLVTAAGRLGGWVATIIVGAALLATANAVLSASLSGSRLLFGMARSGDLPTLLQRTLGQSKSPWLAALVILAVAGGFALVGEIKFVASLSSLGVTLVFAAVNGAVIILRYAEPDLARPFKVPSVGRFPVTAALGVVCSLLLASQYDGMVYLTFLGAILAGVVPYALLHWRSKKGA